MDLGTIGSRMLAVSDGSKHKYMYLFDTKSNDISIVVHLSPCYLHVLNGWDSTCTQSQGMPCPYRRLLLNLLGIAATVLTGSRHCE